MSNLKMNTDAVNTAAGNIKSLNNQIRQGLSNVNNAVSTLDYSWDGNAAQNAIQKYNEIKNSFDEPRYNVLDNFVTFLYQQVEEGYVSTEETNKSLADAFK